MNDSRWNKHATIQKILVVQVQIFQDIYVIESQWFGQTYHKHEEHPLDNILEMEVDMLKGDSILLKGSRLHPKNSLLAIILEMPTKKWDAPNAIIFTYSCDDERQGNLLISVRILAIHDSLVKWLQVGWIFCKFEGRVW